MLTNKLGEAKLRRRSLIAASVTGVVGATLLGSATANAATASDIDDMTSGDPGLNPSFPYASDGLLYHYVSGICVGTAKQGITVLIAESSPPKTVSIAVPEDTQIYGPTALLGNLTAIKIGDRVSIGTSFLSQGVRYARWINVNLLTGWSELVELGDLTLDASPVGEYSRGSVAPMMTLTIAPQTNVIAEDGAAAQGQISHLAVGDLLYWTAVAQTPALISPTATAIVVHSLTRL